MRFQKFLEEAEMNMYLTGNPAIERNDKQIPKMTQKKAKMYFKKACPKNYRPPGYTREINNW